jgi:hypothetical protein
VENDWDTYTISVRMPRALAEQIAARARQDDRSIASLIRMALLRYITPVVPAEEFSISGPDRS